MTDTIPSQPSPADTVAQALAEAPAAVPVSQPPNTKPSGVTQVPLGKLEAQLPFGIPSSTGALHKTIACKDWTAVEEMAIDKLRAESRKTGQFPTLLLSFMYNQVGSHDFSTMEDAEKNAVLAQMYLGDVVYLYVYLRTQVMGTDLPLDLTCPHCGFEFAYQADLNTVKVRTATAAEGIRWRYELKRPIKIRGKEAKAFHLGPSIWSHTQESIARTAQTDQGKGRTKMEVICAAIRQVEGHDMMALIVEDFKLMSKIDIEKLAALIDDNEIGPDLSIKETCPRSTCQRTIHTSLDWGYESFFAVSSRS